jgi:hypothetical protein
VHRGLRRQLCTDVCAGCDERPATLSAPPGNARASRRPRVAGDIRPGSSSPNRTVANQECARRAVVWRNSTLCVEQYRAATCEPASAEERRQFRGRSRNGVPRRRSLAANSVSLPGGTATQAPGLLFSAATEPFPTRRRKQAVGPAQFASTSRRASSRAEGASPCGQHRRAFARGQPCGTQLAQTIDSVLGDEAADRGTVGRDKSRHRTSACEHYCRGSGLFPETDLLTTRVKVSSVRETPRGRIHRSSETTTTPLPRWKERPDMTESHTTHASAATGSGKDLSYARIRRRQVDGRGRPDLGDVGRRRHTQRDRTGAAAPTQRTLGGDHDA